MSDAASSWRPHPIRVRPGLLWRGVRTCSIALVWIGLLATPLLGGLQRQGASDLSAWRPAPGFDMPSASAKLLSADRAEQVLSVSPYVGSGVGIDVFGLSLIDPVAGGAAMLAAPPTARALLGFGLPLLLALLFGRVFCGWFCPFGSLSRGLRRVLEWLPRAPRRRASANRSLDRDALAPHRYRIGSRRWVRFVVLGACLVTGAFGSQLLTTLALPHLALSQSVYGLWLGGGGGAIFGWLLGLIAAGLWLGPTAYCATLCPTGAALSLPGRFRPFRLRIEDVPACGAVCRRCDTACWLSLEPSTGDAGPDCDGCARCAQVCPHDNLRIGVGHGRRKVLPVLAAGLALLVVEPVAAQVGGSKNRPALTLDASRAVGEVDISVGVLDVSEIRLDADDRTREEGSEISVALVRGARPAADRLGRASPREHYAGPLEVRVLDERGDEVERLSFDAPNSPRSTVRRRLFRRRVERVVRAGHAIEVGPVQGWTSGPTRFLIVEPSAGRATHELLWFLVAGLLVGVGGLSLAQATSGERQRA